MFADPFFSYHIYLLDQVPNKVKSPFPRYKATAKKAELILD